MLAEKLQRTLNDNNEGVIFYETIWYITKNYIFATDNDGGQYIITKDNTEEIREWFHLLNEVDGFKNVQKASIDNEKSQYYLNTSMSMAIMHKKQVVIEWFIKHWWSSYFFERLVKGILKQKGKKINNNILEGGGPITILDKAITYEKKNNLDM